MKEVPVGNKLAQVDDADYGLVSQYRWQWSRSRTKREDVYYAVAHVYKDDGKRTTISMHRLIMGAGKGRLVDHINHNGLDNRRVNLRLCTLSQNCRNSRKRGAKGEFKGTWFNNRNQKWGAKILRDGAATHLGYFATERQAALAYDKAAIAFFGEFACLNFDRDTDRSDVTVYHVDNAGPKKTSKFVGVSWCKRYGKWVVFTRLTGKKVNVGAFADELEAARAYDSFVTAHADSKNRLRRIRLNFS